MIGASARALRSLGTWSRRSLRRRWHGHALVLNYHRIADPPHDDPWRLCVGVERFRQQLEVLRSTADVVALTEIDTRSTSAGTRPVVALTFDDGYADNADTALAVLAEFGFPATFFVTTAAIGSSEPFWWDALAARVPDPRRRQSLHQRLVTMDDASRRLELDRLAPGGSLPAPDNGRPMSVAQLERLCRSPLVEIGAHTVTHRFLRHLAPDLQRDEIAGSLRGCERLTGKRPTSFAYPYGALDRHTPALVADCGFARACTTAPDVHWHGTDPFQIPRFAVGDWDASRFERVLHWYWLP